MPVRGNKNSAGGNHVIHWRQDVWRQGAYRIIRAVLQQTRRLIPSSFYEKIERTKPSSKDIIDVLPAGMSATLSFAECIERKRRASTRREH